MTDYSFSPGISRVLVNMQARFVEALTRKLNCATSGQHRIVPTPTGEACFGGCGYARTFAQLAEAEVRELTPEGDLEDEPDENGYFRRRWRDDDGYSDD